MNDLKKTPLWNNKLPLEERLDYLIGQLSLDEKIECLSTECPEVERLQIKASQVGGEAAHGIEARHDQAFNAGDAQPTTSFTQPIGMSGSFDRELIRKCGQAVSKEARAIFAKDKNSSLCRWAPTIDMERDPRWGRTEEAYGEDPYLTGEMASAYIQGMKGEHPFYIRCGATLKHFYANNVEKERTKISSSLDMRNKYEYYLEPFRIAIEKGGAEAVMTSYNEINGVPAIVNPEVQRLLKDAYGLSGHVVCDGGDFQQTVSEHKYFKTHAQTLAYGLKAGVDCFTDDKAVVFAAAKEALSQGLITEEDINRSVRNSFRTRIRLGFFDGEEECPYTGMGEEYLNKKEHQELSAKMAEEAVVLLKNERELLPLLPAKTKSLAVIGPLADVWYKDWYGGVPPYFVTPLEGIRKAYPGTRISYESGLSKIHLTCNGKYVGLDQDYRLFLTDQEHAEIFLLTDWGCGSVTLIAESNGRYVTLEEGSYLIKADKEEAFSWFIRESFQFVNIRTGSLDIDTEEKDAAYYMNSWNGRKVTVDSKGYLAVIKTEPPVVGEMDDEKLNRKCHAVSEGEPAVFGSELVVNGIQNAVKAAKDAEKTIIIVGSNPMINSKEEVDRTTLALPPFQQKLIDETLLVNPDTVVIIVSNYPYSVCRLQEEAPAILYTPGGSQELGTGIAAIVSGKSSPAARLPMTWYRSDQDLPDINDYDIIQGERTYQYFQGEVLYPFGYGLSYSRFAYGPLAVVQEEEQIRVRLNITNTGKAAADEVVQLYVHKETSRVKQPISQLKGFERVKALAPGETREVSFVIPVKELRYYDVISESMVLESSVYIFMAGASSKDIRQQASITIKGQKPQKRDPFLWTAAVLYDSSQNCFVHRGTKGHTMQGETCVIPGSAKDAPNFVDNLSETERSCELCYHDAAFVKHPEKVEYKVCAVEKGEICFSCMGQDGKETKLQVPVKKSETFDFEPAEAKLPEDFVKEGGNYTLRILINGKIKLAAFRFI